MSVRKKIHLFHKNILADSTVTLPASKSLSNRLLIMNALSSERAEIINLSQARDTEIMKQLLVSEKKVLDVVDAGTTMRFLTGYFSVINENKILTGTPRMCERPIGILVEALRELGVEIDYLQNAGFPPLEIKKFGRQSVNKIRMRGDVSSQYISAMLMIAPVLPEGLQLYLSGRISSLPYIYMTLGLMGEFGIQYTWDKNRNLVEIPAQQYKAIPYNVESDWSGASYWYSIIALSERGSVFLKGLKDNSFQGDRIIVDIMANLGVQTEFREDGVKLTKSKSTSMFKFDFSGCPDLVQSVAVVCAANGIRASFRGLESLRIKETDRIAALKNELRKIDADFIEKEKNTWEIIPAKRIKHTNDIIISTYDDHRMAMAFAPLATKTNITIDNPQVVEKSYPGFWEDLKKAGIKCEWR